ncbi:MAG: alanine--glyoxylate aminotransferase family protein [Candidatus Omnitrophica bacterium]|nr:alanine--glyoxylate aminotransferase family protein [Candidatus Omnitrophota bacterium]MBU0895508.1 alanine--glyoxylate aminotransferase family protein [Candidatus Omnitrophota bacterium]MBU1808598.1 alanine--glyoxylate aminotransferase family protein [Candidatus Omnitrophota bacterium]
METMAKKYLMTPGPTPVPEDIRNEMAKPIIHHRTKEYQAIFKDVTDGLKKMFKTANDVYTFTSSGTGAMEASIVNVCSPGDKIIVVRGGKFGERFGDIAKAYGVDVIPLDVPWGSGPCPADIKDLLKANPGVKGVYTTLCETSTATVFDIKAIGEIVKATDALYVVDVISGLGADKFENDAWGVDIAICGSQKGLMIPPGLAFCSVSEKVWKAVEASSLPKFYFNFKKYKKSMAAIDTPFTSAITLVIGLKKALETLNAKGIDNVIAEHTAQANAFRDAAKAMGLGLLSKFPSNAVTAVNTPAGMDADALIKLLKTDYGVTFAGGQEQLKGKLFRAAHMGGIDKEHTIESIKALESALLKMGYNFKAGSGVEAATRILGE